MHIPIFFGLFIIAIIVMRIKMKKNNSNIKAINKAYWEKEQKSLVVRKKNIDDLSYINIKADELPTNTYGSSEIADLRDKVLSLLSEKMISFKGKTNADLRLEYGTANFDKLSLYEERYNTLIKRLYQWGKLLVDMDKQEDALSVLELGIKINTDISKHYILLGNLYKARQDDEKFQKLYDRVAHSDFTLRDNILSSLGRM